jgi:hypothetical protein
MAIRSAPYSCSRAGRPGDVNRGSSAVYRASLVATPSAIGTISARKYDELWLPAPKSAATRAIRTSAKTRSSASAANERNVSRAGG